MEVLDTLSAYGIAIENLFNRRIPVEGLRGGKAARQREQQDVSRSEAGSDKTTCKPSYRFDLFVIDSYDLYQ